MIETRVVGREVRDRRSVPVVIDGAPPPLRNARGGRFYPTEARVDYVRFAGEERWIVEGLITGPALLRDGVIGSHHRRAEWALEDPAVDDGELPMPDYLLEVVEAFHPDRSHGWTGVGT